MKKVIILFIILFISLNINGCTASQSNIGKSNKDIKNINIKKEEKGKTEEKNIPISLLKIDEMSKKDTLWCETEKQKTLAEILNISGRKLNYTESLEYFNELPREKSSFISYIVTSHLKNMGCVTDKENNLELTHSVVPINKNLKFINASLCIISEKLFFATQVSLRVNKKLNYKESLIEFNNLDSYLQNQIINTVTNYLQERKCVK